MRKADFFSLGWISGVICVTILFQLTGQIHLW